RHVLRLLPGPVGPFAIHREVRPRLLPDGRRRAHVHGWRRLRRRGAPAVLVRGGSSRSILLPPATASYRQKQHPWGSDSRRDVARDDDSVHVSARQYTPKTACKGKGATMQATDAWSKGGGARAPLGTDGLDSTRVDSAPACYRMLPPKTAHKGKTSMD